MICSKPYIYVNEKNFSRPCAVDRLRTTDKTYGNLPAPGWHEENAGTTWGRGIGCHTPVFMMLNLVSDSNIIVLLMFHGHVMKRNDDVQKSVK